MRDLFTRAFAATIAMFTACDMASAQQVDEVTAPNGPGRVYVRMLFDDDNGPGTLDVPFDSSFIRPDAGLDLLHLLDIPEIYGFSADDVGDFSLVTATTNILGTQLQARYLETLGAGPTGQGTQGRLSVTLPCRSGPKVSVRVPAGTQGLPAINFDGRVLPDPQGVYTPAPDDISEAAFDNIETDYQNPYSVVFTSNDPNNAAEDAFAVYAQFLESNSTTGPWTYRGNQQFTSQQLLSDVYACSVSGAGVNPLVGNPESLQQTMVEQALDFTAPTLDSNEAPWGLGVRIGRVDRQGAVGTQYDVRINRSFRISEGSRSLFIFDIPVSYKDQKGVRELSASAAAALRVGVSRRWSLEPRLAFGYVKAIDQDLEGQLLAGSVTSLFQFENVGRGTVTLGNMLGYTKVLKTKLYDFDVGNHTDNIVTRNGIAYQLPLSGLRTGQRQSSLRASYMHTYYFGDDLNTESIHEATLSLGVRTRETDSRTSFEVLRAGIVGKFANNYKSGHLFVGYRF